MFKRKDADTKRRFKISYKHIFPSPLVLLDGSNIFEFKEKKTAIRICGKELYKDLYEYNGLFPEINNMETIVEYIGNSEYKDLLTGELFVHYKAREIMPGGCFSVIKNPFQLVTAGLSLQDAEVDYEESKSFLSEVKKEDIKKIRYYFKREKIKMVYESLELFLKDEPQNEKYMKRLDQLRIGEKHLIKYTDLSQTLSHYGTKLDKSDSIEDGYSIEKTSKIDISLPESTYTIVEYKGNHIYQDLISGIFISESPTFFLRVDYDENRNPIVNEDDYNYVMRCPFTISSQNLKYVSCEDISSILNGQNLNEDIANLNRKCAERYKQIIDEIITVINDKNISHRKRL